jgi:hypothetical protein
MMRKTIFALAMALLGYVVAHAVELGLSLKTTTLNTVTVNGSGGGGSGVNGAITTPGGIDITTPGGVTLTTP